MAAVTGVSKVEANFRQILETKKENLIDAIKKVQRKVVRDAKDLAPVAFGHLRKSIKPQDITITAGEIVAPIIAESPYAVFVELGTKPHFPPVKPLRKWSKKVLGDLELGFVVARAISKRGTRPQPYLGPAILANKSTYRNALIRVLKK
jgi:HK97 gp10 family phage protein